MSDNTPALTECISDALIAEALTAVLVPAPDACVPFIDVHRAAHAWLAENRGMFVRLSPVKRVLRAAGVRVEYQPKEHVQAAYGVSIADAL